MKESGTGMKILGDSAPWSPVLFGYDIDATSGIKVADSHPALQCVSQGATFRQPPLARARAGYKPFTASMSNEEELSYLKNQAEAGKSHLDKIESRIRDLEAKE